MATGDLADSNPSIISISYVEFTSKVADDDTDRGIDIDGDEDGVNLGGLEWGLIGGAGALLLFGGIYAIAARSRGGDDESDADVAEFEEVEVESP